MRIAGQHHLVQNNYISNCDHGIDILCGDYITEDLTGKYEPQTQEGTPLGRVPTYGKVKDLRLIGNILVANKTSDLEIGRYYKRLWPADQMVLIPEECHIDDNRFVRPRGGVSIIGTIPETSQPLD